MNERNTTSTTSALWPCCYLDLCARVFVCVCMADSHDRLDQTCIHHHHQQLSVSLAANTSSQPFAHTLWSDAWDNHTPTPSHFLLFWTLASCLPLFTSLSPSVSYFNTGPWLGPKRFLPNGQSQSAVCWINTWARQFIIAPLWHPYTEQMLTGWIALSPSLSFSLSNHDALLSAPSDFSVSIFPPKKQ